MQQEMTRLDVRRNLISEVASLFWAPKALVGFQIQEILKTTQETAGTRESNQHLPEGGRSQFAQDLQQAV